jgi:WhiB family redox-sensing transcriptional regulator
MPSDAYAGSLGWMSQGACQGVDPELFFPVAPTGPALREIDAAKAVCRSCTVRAPCLSYGLETRQDGIWGGTTMEERFAMREPSGWPGRDQGDRLAGSARCDRPGQQSGRTVQERILQKHRALVDG